MKIRATITFRPDDLGTCAPAVEDFATFEAASAWSDVMERIHPGATSELAQVCEEHGPEDIHECADCTLNACDRQATATLSSHDEVLCEDCVEMRAEDAEAEYDPRPPVAAEQPEVLR